MIKTTLAILITVCLLVGLGAAYAAQTSFVFSGTGTGQIGQTFQLMGMTQRVQSLEQDKAHRVTPAQAVKMLKLLKPLRSKPKLTAQQVSGALAGMKAILTPAQIKAADALSVKNAPKMPAGAKPGTKTGYSFHSTSKNGVTTSTTTWGPGGGPKGGSSSSVRVGPNGVVKTQSSTGMLAPDFNPFYTKPSPTGLPSKITVANMNEFFSLLETRAKGK